MYENIVKTKTRAYCDQNGEIKAIRQDMHVRFYLFIVLSSL